MSRPQATPRRSVVHRIDVWSVAKVSLPFYAAAVLTWVGLLILLWGALVSTGSVDAFESFVEDTGYRNFEFVPAQMLSGLWSSALILIVVGTAFNIVAVIVFNLLSSMLGGLQVVTQDRPTRRQLRRAAR
ncbi:MAG: DUF3566 domain-containing protein [Acidimicrobiales bacterium]|nr:DUF3566 domain-containing protein [Acidimicrobiales bacterium]MCB9373328.1 DUF3566 domain-containing protein [Microthrixaceae bacterium]